MWSYRLIKKPPMGVALACLERDGRDTCRMIVQLKAVGQNITLEVSNAEAVAEKASPFPPGYDFGCDIAMALEGMPDFLRSLYISFGSVCVSRNGLPPAVTDCIARRGIIALEVSDEHNSRPIQKRDTAGEDSAGDVYEAVRLFFERLPGEQV